MQRGSVSLVKTFPAAVTSHKIINLGIKSRLILKTKNNLFQSCGPDELSDEFGKRRIPLTIRIIFTFIPVLFKLYTQKSFYKPLHVSGCNFPCNVKHLWQPAALALIQKLRHAVFEKKFGSPFSRRVFSSALVRVCVLSAVFAYLSKIAMFSSWDTPLLGSGFLLSWNSLGSLLKDGDWPYWSSFMLLSHPVVAHQRDSYQSANTHTECRLGYCTPQY